MYSMIMSSPVIITFPVGLYFLSILKLWLTERFFLGVHAVDSDLAILMLVIVEWPGEIFPVLDSLILDLRRLATRGFGGSA